REKNTPAGRYFELGVGKGALYQRFMAAGWQCMGVEPGSWGKFPGIVGSIDELPADAKFDRLVAFDVLEHVERPIDFLTRMRSASVLGAKLYFSVPNIDSFRARRQRAKWRMVRPLGHTHYFSKSSVQALLKSAGFAVEVLSTNDMFRMQDLKHGLRPAVSGLLQATGQGDQMLVVAKAV
ncbi:MAG: methyltransferase type 12, partial [Phycisphaerales bacterium]|nr:methyltransferase type 12 [Phycisphaerales bacterium]